MPLCDPSDALKPNYSVVRSGTGLPFLENHPEYLEKSEMYERVAVPDGKVFEECFKQEA